MSVYSAGLLVVYPYFSNCREQSVDIAAVLGNKRTPPFFRVSSTRAIARYFCDEGADFAHVHDVVHPRGPIQWARGIYAAARGNIKANLFRAREGRAKENRQRGNRSSPFAPLVSNWTPECNLCGITSYTPTKFIAKTMLNIVWFIFNHRDILP